MRREKWSRSVLCSSCGWDNFLEYKHCRNPKCQADLSRDKALVLVLSERRRQDDGSGLWNLEPFAWRNLLNEKVDAFSRCLYAKFSGDSNVGLREEIVQVAAVALAMVEAYERNGMIVSEEVGDAAA